MGGSKTLPNTNIYWSIYLGYINMYGINKIVDNTRRPLRYHRDYSVVVFWYYQQKYPTLKTWV